MGIVLALLLGTLHSQGPPPQIAPGVASPAAAFADRTVERVEVLIEGVPTAEPVIESLVEVRAGAPLRMAVVRETIAHLYSLGRFQEIFAEAEESAGGVVIRFNLIPVRTVERIEFRGNLRLGSGSLRRAVTDRFGAAPPAARAANVAEMLQGYYFDRGYLAASIRPGVEERLDLTVLTFEIEAGVQAVIRNVNITGDPGEPRDAFLRRIRALPGQPYERVTVQSRLSSHVDRLRRQGRYEAEANHRIAEIVEDGRGVNLAISIEAGPLITLRFEGDPLPSDRIEELVPIQREGSIDADIIEDSEARIVTYLTQLGHWKATVTSSRREVPTGIELVFTVRRGPVYRIAATPQLTGNLSIAIEDLRPQLLNLQPGEIFTSANLDAASSAIRNVYLTRGYAQVKVESAPNEVPSDKPTEGRILPAIVITEGPMIRVGEVTFSGNEAIGDAELAPRVTQMTGAPYYEPQLLRDRENILSEYLNRGFASATVAVKPTVVDGSRVDIVFNVIEGSQTIVERVLIIGNVRTDPRVIEREIQLKPGQPLGLEALFETRRRLAALGLFRRVTITEIPHGDGSTRNLLVRVEEAPPTTIGYGGGLEYNRRLGTGVEGQAQEEGEVAPRGFFEVGRRNLGGRNRAVSMYSRLSLRSGLSDGTSGGSAFSFPEYRVVTTYREPRTFVWNADVTVTGAVEQGIRSAFSFARKGVTSEVQRRFVGRRGIDPVTFEIEPATAQYVWGGRYTFSTTRTFDEQLDEEDQVQLDRIFPQVRLSMFSTTIARDTRDDSLDPSRGLLVGADATVAARALGGQVGFTKAYLQSSAYRRLPGPRRVVVAGRLALGLATGFPREVETVGPDGEVIVQTLRDLPASERFFAGGDTTIRGFALDSVGTARTITAGGFPRGGHGLVLMNAELRVPVTSRIGSAFFIDGGNVFERTSQIDLGELRGAVGFGLRYRSPIGPLRLDLGFKLDRRESERGYALHFSFGQAF